MPPARGTSRKPLFLLTAIATLPESTTIQADTPQDERFLFAGHQTFSLRISWLPKAASALNDKVNPFADPRDGMQRLGIGKNMVESLRCWVEFYGVAEFDAAGRNPQLTDFGQIVLGPKGCDPYLEDERTLWLLHWNASTNLKRRFFAWYWVCNAHPEAEFTYDEALRAFKAQTETQARPLSPTTLRQHLDVFLGTYVQSTTPLTGVVAEDLLESPLAVLGFVKRGEPRPGTPAKDIPFMIDAGPKAGVSDELFRFCVHDGWSKFAGSNETCSYRQLGQAINSPGRVFRLPERDLHERLVQLSTKWPKEFSLIESNNQRQLRRVPTGQNLAALLKAVYGVHD